jgi:hypothetical protein
MLDVPRELVGYVSRLLAAGRRVRRTRKHSRALTCWRQALFVLARFRQHHDLTTLGAGFRISRATAYRYWDEGVDALAAQAPDLHNALERVAADGWSHVILDGKVFDTDRATTDKILSRKGKVIDAWYTGKTHDFGGNIQAVMRPDGLPIWVSDVRPGSVHDLTCAREQVLGALYWAASQLHLPTLADGGYTGAGIGVHTPIPQPDDHQILDPDTRSYNQLLRALRCLGERGFALLIGRWRALQHITASPHRIGTITKAALVLTHFEHHYLPR